MKKGLIIATLLLTLTRLCSSAQSPYIHHYTMQDGLPSNMVYHVFQDSKKFIWFATDAGVTRYDGTTFQNFRKKDGLSNNEIIRIKEDWFGRVWFCHFNGSLSFYFKNEIYSETNTSFLKSIERKEFYFDFLQDEDSTIYFYNRFCEITALDKYNSIRRYNLHDKLWRTIPPGFVRPPDLYLRKITKTADKEFLFWTRDGLFKLKSFLDQPRFIPPKQPVYMVFTAGNNKLFLNNYTDKLYIFRDENKIDSISLPLYTLAGLTAVMENTGDILWVADYYKGVYCLRRDTILHRFDIKKPQSIVRDHENNTWISTVNDGVFKISPYLLSHLHYPSSLFRQKSIIGLSHEYSGGIWISNGSQVQLLKKHEFYDVNLRTGEDYFNLVCQVNKQSMIIGERGGAFYTLEGLHTDYIKKEVKFRRSKKVNSPVKAVAMKRNGMEISAFSILSLYRSEPDKMFRERTANIIPQRIYSIFYDQEDNLILNCRQMFFFRENKLEPCLKLSRFNNKIITNHLNIGESTELFNIEGDSIYLYNSGRFYNLSNAFRTQIDPQIRNIICEGRSLYLSTSSNVYKCENPLDVFSNNKARLQIIDVNFRNVNDILVNNDSLYIASEEGLTVIPESSVKNQITHVPIPYIRSIIVNDQVKDPSNTGISIRGNTKIAFSFGCINYSAAPVIYAYKMVGLDTSWTTGTSGNVVYQRLVNGNYEFMVKVRKSTSDAEWSNVATYPLEIKASFWQHPLFFVFVAVFVLGGITLFILRRKNLQMKQGELNHHLVTLELKALQSMMNPHFIFNALGSIQNFLLQNKTGEAGLYLSQFARLIRQNMNALSEAVISLDEEFDRLSNYLDLERLRMENKFDYKIETDEGFDPEDIVIPSMIIQPFVENSIWHGFSTLDEKGFIHIMCSLHQEKSLQVIIEDNGVGIKKAATYNSKGEKHLHIGMEMTRKRLELLGRKYAVKTTIEFSEAFPGNPNPGTRVVIIIPISNITS